MHLAIEGRAAHAEGHVCSGNVGLVGALFDTERVGCPPGSNNGVSVSWRRNKELDNPCAVVRAEALKQIRLQRADIEVFNRRDWSRIVSGGSFRHKQVGEYRVGMKDTFATIGCTQTFKDEFGL